MEKHFLLVDEDVAELRLFREAFEQMNIDCKCTYANDLRHAIQIMEYLTPDKLFVRLDPDISENLAQIRNIRRNKKLKASEIIVYCDNMHYYSLVARGHGADHCVNKPHQGQNIRDMMEFMMNDISGRETV